MEYGNVAMMLFLPFFVMLIWGVIKIDSDIRGYIPFIAVLFCFAAGVLASLMWPASIAAIILWAASNAVFKYLLKRKELT